MPDPSTSSLAFARLSAQDDRKGGVSPLPYPANRRYCIILPVARTAACRRCRVPRTGVTALSCPLRGQRRVAVAVFRERALLHCTTLFRGQRRRICFCGAHEIILSLAQNHGFCAIGAAATERGCRPRFTRLAQSGVCRRRVAAAVLRSGDGKYKNFKRSRKI